MAAYISYNNPLHVDKTNKQELQVGKYLNCVDSTPVSML